MDESNIVNYDAVDVLDYIYHDYSVDDFKSAFSQKRSYGDKLIEILANRMADAGLLKILKASSNKSIQYVANMSDELINAIENKVIKLDNDKDGRILAQIREDNGQFGKKIDLKKVVNGGDFDFAGAAQALQMKAIEAKLDDVINTLSDIGESVESVRIGQQNDRIGEFHSGLNLYMEYMSIEDERLKEIVLAEALKTLSDAQGKMIQDIQTNMNFLLAGKHKEHKGKSVEAINEKMRDINMAYEIIYKIALLKAQIYYQRGELPAMLSVLNAYGNFLSKVVVQNADKMAEFDVRERNKNTKGIWEKRANSLLEIKELRNVIESRQSNYMMLEDAQNG